MSYVAFVLECNIDDRPALDAVMTDLTTSVESNEPGTLIYEWSISEDGSSLTTYERFTDADAALAHMGNFGAYAERFTAAVTPTRLLVFGSPSAALKEALAAFAPVYVSQIGGFHR